MKEKKLTAAERKKARIEKRINVRKSLMDQLTTKSADVEHYVDMIDDYMNFWDTKNALSDDIKKRGVMYKDKSSVGVEMQKNNPSVKELVMVNRQMLSILKEMGLSTENIAKNCEDKDDDEM